MKIQSEKAFTLVELAIVLIIIGLIVGGVVGANSLIESSKRQNVIKDIEGFKTAINAFSLEYDALPGDFPEAYDYWGANCGSDVLATSNNGGCNGDNDKQIEISISSYGENLMAWKHLSLAEIIDGSFTGTSPLAIGTNLPAGAIGTSGYEIRYFTVNSISRNRIRLGGLEGTTDLRHAGISPRDIYNIDKKLDDGLPELGKIMAARGNGLGSGCVTSSTYERNRDITCVAYFDVD